MRVRLELGPGLIASRQSMPSNKRRSTPPPDIDDHTLRSLATIGTKSGLARVLTTLSRGGWLASEMCASQRLVKRRVDTAVRVHADAETPYGRVMQPMSLPSTSLPSWQVVHPLALMFHLSAISTAFANMLVSVHVPGKPLHVIFYVDEVCPGSPLRPEKSRTLQCLYWTFVEFPDWLLSRTSAWFCLGTIRSTVVDQLPGNLSQLVAVVMAKFFSPTGPSFESGFTVCKGADRVTMKAVFGGFLCDEKAHKQVVDCKGASGWKPCVSCRNVMSRVDRAAMRAHGAVPVSHANPADFDRHTNESVYTVVDHLQHVKATRPARQYQEESSLLGFNTNPQGVMLDPNMRRFHRPIDHTIRDWMHVIVNGGVANVEVFNIVDALSRVGIKPQQIQDFIEQFTLPSKYGKVSRTWLGPNRLSKKKRTLTSFAGVMLSLVPIVCCFLQEAVAPTGAIPEHVQCFCLLTKMLSCLQLGPTGAAAHAATLRDTVLAHARLFSKIYPDSCTPAFHQLLHVDDNIRYLGKVLSCFTTERKHCDVKRVALHVFRNIDNTSVKHVLNEQCETIAHESESMFVDAHLVATRPALLGNLNRSHRAVLRIGRVQAGDVVYLSRHVVGKLDMFWSRPGMSGLIAQLGVYKPSDIGYMHWDTASPTVEFIDVNEIVDAVAWASVTGPIVRVLPPFVGHR